MNRKGLMCAIAVVLTASLGAAQDKGDFTIFAKRAFAAGLAATPLTNTGLGMSYQLTRHVELHPGVFAEAGVSRTLRHRYVWTGSAWEQAPDHKALRPLRSGFGLVLDLH